MRFLKNIKNLDNKKIRDILCEIGLMMTTKTNNTFYKKISTEHLVQLINLAHNTLQNDKDLLYDIDYHQDLYTIYKNNSRIISYGGRWTPDKKYWPEIIRISATLGQQIHSDLNCEIRLSNSSIFGHVQPDFYNLAYYPHKEAAYGAIPDSECDKIKSEIFHITKTHKRIAVR